MYAIQLADKRFINYGVHGWKFTGKTKTYRYKFKAEQELQHCMSLVNTNIRIRTEYTDKYKKKMDHILSAIARHQALIKELEDQPYSKVATEIKQLESRISALESNNHDRTKDYYYKKWKSDFEILQEATMILALNPQVVELED